MRPAFVGCIMALIGISLIGYSYIPTELWMYGENIVWQERYFAPEFRTLFDEYIHTIKMDVDTLMMPPDYEAITVTYKWDKGCPITIESKAVENVIGGYYLNFFSSSVCIIRLSDILDLGILKREEVENAFENLFENMFENVEENIFENVEENIFENIEENIVLENRENWMVKFRCSLTHFGHPIATYSITKEQFTYISDTFGDGVTRVALFRYLDRLFWFPEREAFLYAFIYENAKKVPHNLIYAYPDREGRNCCILEVVVPYNTYLVILPERKWTITYCSSIWLGHQENVAEWYHILVERIGVKKRYKLYGYVYSPDGVPLENVNVTTSDNTQMILYVTGKTGYYEIILEENKPTTVFFTISPTTKREIIGGRSVITSIQYDNVTIDVCLTEDTRIDVCMKHTPIDKIIKEIIGKPIYDNIKFAFSILYTFYNRLAGDKLYENILKVENRDGIDGITIHRDFYDTWYGYYKYSFVCVSLVRLFDVAKLMVKEYENYGGHKNYATFKFRFYCDNENITFDVYELSPNEDSVQYLLLKKENVKDIVGLYQLFDRIGRKIATIKVGNCEKVGDNSYICEVKARLNKYLLFIPSKEFVFNYGRYMWWIRSLPLYSKISDKGWFRVEVDFDYRQVKVYGYVYDRYEKPLSDVIVMAGRYTYTTSSDGYYEVFIPYDKHTEVKFYKENYGSVSENFRALLPVRRDVVLYVPMLYGFVIDDFGRPLENALVISRLSTWRTDNTGYYEVLVQRGVPSIIVAQKENYYTRKMIMLLDTDKPFDIVMRDNSLPLRYQTVYGYITDENGNPIPGIIIYAENNYYITDNSGYYEIQIIENMPTYITYANYENQFIHYYTYDYITNQYVENYIYVYGENVLQTYITYQTNYYVISTDKPLQHDVVMSEISRIQVEKPVPIVRYVGLGMLGMGTFMMLVDILTPRKRYSYTRYGR